MADDTIDTNESSTPELIDFKDPVTGKVIKITKEIQEVIGHQTSVTRKVETSKLKEELEALKSQISTVAGDKEKLAEMLQRIEEEKLSEAEKQQKVREREAAKIEAEKTALKNEAATNFKLFESTKIDNDIMSATAGYDFNNIRQAMQVLKLDGQAGLVKLEDGSYKTVLKMQDENGDPIEMSPKDAIAQYFTKPENAHHLRKNIIAGSGSNPVGVVDATGANVFRKDDMKKPEVRKAILQKFKNGEQVKFA